MSLAGRVGDHQAAAVQHAEELLQLFEGDFLRRKLGLEPLLDFVEAGCPVEHLQDGELFFLEAVVGQADRVFHHPVAAAEIVLPLATGRAACGWATSGGTRQQTVLQGDHGGMMNDDC